MKKTLYEKLVNYKNLGRSSFHTPGHKNTYGVLPKNLMDVDLTELPETDSLYEASGIIDEAEKKASKLFKAKRTLFSAGGCTLCIQTMIRLAAPHGGKAIVSRMLHKSAVNVMALLRVEPIWVLPKKSERDDSAFRVDAGEIEQKLSENRNVKFVYITSPDYYGVISDVRAISEVCKKYNVPLLVDNAHGSHLKFFEESLHPLDLGADMTADSAHKTLPVLTGGAFLHINNEKFIADAKSAMGLFGSTSPFYPTMASLDLARNWLELYGREEFIKLKKLVKVIKDLAEQKGIKQPSGLCDPVRICLNTASIGLTGDEFAGYLRKNGIEPEFADYSNVVLIPTPMNTDEDFQRLEMAINRVESGHSKIREKRLFNIPKIAVPIHEAIFLEHYKIKVKDSKGKISAQTVCPCPPGIPILVPGEIISETEMEILLRYGISELNVLK